MLRRALAASALTLATAAGLTVAISPAAQAFPQCAAGYLCNIAFYSDAAHTRLVGARTWHCNGSYNEWGTGSSYHVWSAMPCGGGGGEV